MEFFEKNWMAPEAIFLMLVLLCLFAIVIVISRPTRKNAASPHQYEAMHYPWIGLVIDLRLAHEVSKHFPLKILRFLCFGIFLFSAKVMAGPPYVTDDPEPVELRHWEVYGASQLLHDPDGWTGTAPHIEINYGTAPNLQLHLITPASFSAPVMGPAHYGYGDTELGAKYRFVQETNTRPQIGEFLLLELPTGDADRGLGAGHLQVFLPIWLQKTIGPWLMYGGGGYWLTTGTSNQNWWYFGYMLQYRFRPNLAIGTELFHTTSKDQNSSAETRFNVGLVYDFSEPHHLLLSAGRGIEGPNFFQSYVAYQLTIGPKD